MYPDIKELRNKLLKAQEKIDADILSRTCALCKRIIGEDEPVYAVFPVISFDVSDLQGLFVPLITADIPLIGMVATEDSDAWKDGKKIIMPTCSEECAKLTKELIKRQLEINYQKGIL